MTKQDRGKYRGGGGVSLLFFCPSRSPAPDWQPSPQHNAAFLLNPEPRLLVLALGGARGRGTGARNPDSRIPKPDSRILLQQPLRFQCRLKMPDARLPNPIP